MDAFVSLLVKAQFITQLQRHTQKVDHTITLLSLTVNYQLLIGDNNINGDYSEDPVCIL